MALFTLIASVIVLLIMYVYLNYKFHKKLEIVKLMLDRATYMSNIKHSPEVINTELTKNNDRILQHFDKYNKNDIAILSNLLQRDSQLFIDIAASSKDENKIKLWMKNASDLADKLNEIDSRKWSSNRGEILLHNYQNSVIAGLNNNSLSFDDIRDNAVKIGLFL
jgi:hypothetical protein